MNLEIRACKPKELSAIIGRIDQEFVFNKQRSISLGKRFPNTLSIQNIEQIRVAVLDGAICGTLSIRRFEWVVEKYVWHGAMVGMVWVDPQHRGKGIGFNLLSSATQFLRETGVDFGVLWTGTPSFYERAGWFLNDRGLFGQVVNRPNLLNLDTVSCRPLASVDAKWLERLRSSSLPMRVARNSLDYCTVPIPAVHVMCFSAQRNDGSEGFALVGEEDGTGYFYEMVAPSILWGIIWSAVTDRFNQLFVNGHLDDPFVHWLTENSLVVWRPQNKAMWLRISGCIEGLFLNAWHIPYFDWI